MAPRGRGGVTYKRAPGADPVRGYTYTDGKEETMPRTILLHVNVALPDDSREDVADCEDALRGAIEVAADGGNLPEGEWVIAMAEEI